MYSWTDRNQQGTSRVTNESGALVVCRQDIPVPFQDLAAIIPRRTSQKQKNLGAGFLEHIARLRQARKRLA